MTAAVKLGWNGPMPATHSEYDDKPRSFLETDYIAICPGWGGHSREEWKRKAWPHWAELCAQSKLPIAVVGGKGESEKRAAGYRRYFGSLSIGQAASVLKGASCVVSVDNGLAHIAAALGVRTVVLFGATTEVKNRPLGRDVRVVTAQVRCRPCQMTRRWDGCADWRCMKEITPEMVWEAMR